MIEIAKSTRINELKEIWRKSFEDPEEYIDFFMQNAFENTIPVTCIRDGISVGVIYMFECEEGNTGKKAYYWYAGGVLPEYRKSGVFKEIVDYILKYTTNEGAISFCYAMPELREFYMKSGMDRFYHSVNIKIEMGKEVSEHNIVCSGLKVKEYKELRERTFAGGSYIRWDEKYLEYAIREKQFCHGICDKIDIGGKTYAIVGDVSECCLNIEETTMNYDELIGMAEQLAALYCIQKINARIPRFMIDKSVREPEIFSGLGNMDSGNFWISLTLL